MNLNTWMPSRNIVFGGTWMVDDQNDYDEGGLCGLV